VVVVNQLGGGQCRIIFEDKVTLGLPEERGKDHVGTEMDGYSHYCLHFNE